MVEPEKYAVTAHVKNITEAIEWLRDNVDRRDFIGSPVAYEDRDGTYTLSVHFSNPDAAVLFKLFWSDRKDG